MSRLIKVLKGSRKADTYLYVDFAEGLARVPPALIEQLGETADVLALKLTPERKLARADAAEVLRQIEAVGYYLQLPPATEEVLPPLRGERS